MAKVLLDIGAGNTSFVKNLKSYNPKLRFLYLCGDRRLKGLWNGDATHAGVRKIFALYSAFNVPDQSLDAVTLNGLNLFDGGTHGIEAELIRTLKPKGLFFAAHPIGLFPRLDEDIFKPVLFTECTGMLSTIFASAGFSRRGLIFSRWSSLIVLPDCTKVEYPASPTIRDRIMYLSFKERGITPPSQGYIYRGTDKQPSVRVWMKQE